MDLGFQLIPI